MFTFHLRANSWAPQSTQFSGRHITWFNSTQIWNTLKGHKIKSLINKRDQKRHSIHVQCLHVLQPKYLLCRLPEMPGVGQPAIEFGQLLQHVSQLSEGGPFPQVVRPAGGQDLLKPQFIVSHCITKHYSQWHQHLYKLTVTSLPRFILARTFFMPSPLPTCQMVASIGWFVIGQSRAWSSYQMVLWRVRYRKSVMFRWTCHLSCCILDK